MGTAIEAFHDADTGTVTHLVWDDANLRAAVIDPVLDFDIRSGRTGTRSVQQVLERVQALGLQVDWLLETHAHADHLSGAPWLREHLPAAQLAIGRHIGDVQRVFGPLFDVSFDATSFDRLFDDGDRFRIGGLEVEVLHTPGHTPACVSYRVDRDDVFVGDTLFMPDYGSARCDFPGGDAAALYRSVQRLLALPPHTRLHLCHDYPEGREASWVATVAEQRANNRHLHDGVDEAAFVALRTARDRTLPLPALMLPAVQVNLAGGRLPPAAGNGRRYLKIPLDTL